MHFIYIFTLALTFTILWANSADDKLRIFFPENRLIFHEMSNPVFWKKFKKCFKMSSAENFTQSAKH